MKKLLTILAVLLLGWGATAQTVGRKAPKITLLGYDAGKDDGLLQFEVDVRMADCISYVEFKTEGSKKSIQVAVSEKDYFLSETNGRDILLRIPVGTLRELMRKKENWNAELVVFSKSGQAIYNHRISILKSNLISTTVVML